MSPFVLPNRRAWLAGVVVVVAIGAWVGVCRVDLVSAAKPGSGAKPTGMIYYTRFSTPVTYQMYDDGSSKTQVALPPGLVASPSSQVYGGLRWWLAADIGDTGFPELFAYDEEGGAVQLTSAGPDVLIGMGAPRWSNDGQDRFATFHADIGGEGFLCRLWISAIDIAAIEAGAPRFTGADLEPVLPHAIGYADYSWSNNDWMLAYLKFNYDDAGDITSRTIWVRTLTDPPSDVPIHTRTSAEGTIMSTGSGNYFQWSPDGSRIAFSTYNSSSYGGVWTILPDGTQAVKVKSNSGTLSYTSRGWSPNGQELLLHTIKDRGFGTWYYNLARMAAGGGPVTTLTSDVTQTSDKTAIDWVPLGP
jgi:hypothetical protein